MHRAGPRGVLAVLAQRRLPGWAPEPAPVLVPDRFPFLPDLYRRAMLALKVRQERKQQSAIVP